MIRCSWCWITLRWWQFWRIHCPTCAEDRHSPPYGYGERKGQRW